ncbi:MAG TPA: amidohydrolase [Firmicutes bacterium]|nr:amidohydrolase [Candidatus Fermentithermobacillaceae bacterium]
MFPISRPPIEKGLLLVRDGKIVFAGQGEVPADAEVIDLTGKTVLPGFVDEHAHVGLWGEWYGQPQQDGNEATNPVTPEVRAIDSVWPAHSAFNDARSGGVTTVQVTPGSGNIIGGEMAVIKTVGKVIDDMIVKNPSGMKAALGENPKGLYGRNGKMPSTRMGNAAVLRAALYKAKDYEKKLAAAEKDPTKAPDTDLGLLGLLKVLRGEIPLRIHAHRADDIVTAVRIAEEFGIDFSIEHCTDGATVAEFLGKRKAKVNVGPSMWHRAKVETWNISLETAGILAKAGCRVSIISDHPFHPIQFLSTAAAMCWANGMSEEDALRAVTLTPAETLGVADRVGSLDEGKDADFVVWSGHPFQIRSKVEQVFIGGVKVFG